MIRPVLVAALLAAAATAGFALTDAAEAKKARCYTSDDGEYDCDFRQFGGNGSFMISAPLMPNYTLEISDRGVAEGFADFGSGNVVLPGPFYRSGSDRACWISDATDFEICAY